MSFRCERCHEAQPARAKPNIVVTEWRDRADQPRQIKKEERICDRCAGKPVVERPVVLKIVTPAPEIVEQKATA